MINLKDIKNLGVANILTIFRIVCIPVFLTVFILKFYLVALIVFSLAAYTDLIDGTVARLRKEKSDLGAILDPFADKGLMISVFVALAVTRVVPWWFVYIVLIRDAVVISGYTFIKARRLPVKITVLVVSKFATLFEILTGVMALIYLTWPTASIWVYPVGDIAYGCVLVTAVLVLVATMQYLKMGLNLLEQKGKSNA